MRLELCYCGNRVRPPRVRFCSFFCQERASRAEAYGLTGATYLALMVGQGGSCALCGRTFELEVLKPVIDHDHRTGFVRGLLCQACNMRIRYFEAALRGDRPIPNIQRGDFEARATLYLERGRLPE